MPEVTTSVPEDIKGLCERCESLRLDDDYNQELGPFSPIIITVSPDSIQECCMLCNVFSDFLQGGEDLSDSNAEHGEDLDRVELNPDHISKDSILVIQHLVMQEFYLHMRYFTIKNKAFPDRILQCFPLQPPISQYKHRAQRIGPGRLVDAVRADLGRVETWIGRCEMYHSSRSGSTCSVRRPLGIPLSIIDCKTRQVRLAREGEPYICLSYVWGQSYSHANLCGPDLPELVPKTIEDAIFVALELGIPQLWVDQYCISQTNPEDKHNAIASMHLIYGCAVLTIVAVGSSDASSGLPGVRGTLRHAQRQLAIGPYSFILFQDLREELKTSRWNTRGWTFQEALLSPRRLVFSKSQLYFQCEEAHFFEAIDEGFQSDQRWRDLRVWPSGGVGNHHFAPYDRLQEYFPRHLSFGSDALAAFEGILHRLASDVSHNMRVAHFYGIPLIDHFKNGDFLRRSFAFGLTWRLENSGTSMPMVQPNQGPNQFPSWTWAAYKSMSPNSMNNLVFECDQLVAKTPWGDSIEAENAAFRFITHTGEEVDLIGLITHLSHSSPDDFLPCINITTWVITTRLFSVYPKEGGKDPVIRMSANNTVFYDDNRQWGGEEVKALYMSMGTLSAEQKVYQFVFLIVHETTPGIFSRVGLWCAILPELKPGVLPTQELLEAILPAREKGRKATFRKETVRLM
ncbi:heterokaryon incompatibility protein-domain-containing protein [Pyrenochaeta sp. MPI-SDFR-AT-0127]|nr:heterokaryon incompatibility protein-domain-containing protein [Pyrenochaeta sp. MPI-SDFR-AT-0127]